MFREMGFSLLTAAALLFSFALCGPHEDRCAPSHNRSSCFSCLRPVRSRPYNYIILRFNTFAAVNTSPIAMSLYIESSAVLILQGWFDEEGVLLTCLITPQLVVAADAPAIGDAPIAPTPLDVVMLKDGSVLLWRSHRHVWWGALYQDCGCCGQYRQDTMGQRGEAGHQPPNPVSSQKKGQC
jgi:hypothetical protein